ncbi:hypothetical protein HanIR_Chr17g0887721 [Helianthus annuus]|nr:hypothetical protein HanIR_Chr17g0887721 [Helianthus annuus]
MSVACKGFRPISCLTGFRPFIASTTLVTRASSSSWIQNAIDQVGWGSGFGQVGFG